MFTLNKNMVKLCRLSIALSIALFCYKAKIWKTRSWISWFF